MHHRPVSFDLANPFQVETPQETFLSLEKACFLLDIDRDVYGKVFIIFCRFLHEKGRSIQELEEKVSKLLGKQDGMVCIRFPLNSTIITTIVELWHNKLHLRSIFLR